MSFEQLRGRLAELVHIGARGVECREQRLRVLAHCGLDQNWLAQLGFPQSGFDIGRGLIDAAAAAGATQRAAEIRLTDSLAAEAGVGAIANTPRASGLAMPSVNRPVKTAKNVG